MSERRKVALKILTEKLEKERPVIVRDPRDDSYYLFLKGLSETTLGREISSPGHDLRLQEIVSRYLVDSGIIEPLLRHEFITPKADFEILHFNERSVVAFPIPGGQKAIEAMEQMYKSEKIKSPFQKGPSLEDENLDAILTLQGIGQDSGRGA